MARTLFGLGIIFVAISLNACSAMPDLFYPIPKIVRGLAEEEQENGPVSRQIQARYQDRPTSFFVEDLRSQGFYVFRDEGRDAEMVKMWGGQIQPPSIISEFTRPNYLGIQRFLITCEIRGDICAKLGTNVTWIGP